LHKKLIFLIAFSYAFSPVLMAVFNFVWFLTVVIVFFHALALKYSFIYKAVLVLVWFGFVWLGFAFLVESPPVFKYLL